MSQIEGEITGLLRDVIVSQTVYLKVKYGDHGPQGSLPPNILPGKLRRPWHHHVLIAVAIAYQFAKIGNDEVAQDPVVDLSKDDLLAPYSWGHL